MIEIDTETLEQRLSLHELWLKNEKKPGYGLRLELEGMDLSGKDLSGRDLSSARISNCDMTGTNLQRGNLSEATIRNTTLNKANLAGSIMNETVLRNTVAKDTNFSGARMKRVNMHGMELTGSQFTDSIIEHCDFHEAVLENTNLRGADIDNCYMGNVILEGANLQDAVFTTVNLKDAQMNTSDTHGTIFNECKVNNIKSDVDPQNVKKEEESIIASKEKETGSLEPDSTKELLLNKENIASIFGKALHNEDYDIAQKMFPQGNAISVSRFAIATKKTWREATASLGVTGFLDQDDHRHEIAPEDDLEMDPDDLDMYAYLANDKYWNTDEKDYVTMVDNLKIEASMSDTGEKPTESGILKNLAEKMKDPEKRDDIEESIVDKLEIIGDRIVKREEGDVLTGLAILTTAACATDRIVLRERQKEKSRQTQHIIQ